jgi:hypothetical protein
MAGQQQQQPQPQREPDMRTIYTSTTVHTFDELDEAAREKVIECFAYMNVDHPWWESTYDLIQAAGRCLGIECEVKAFDFGRGAGVSLGGHYAYNKGWRKALREEFGGDLLVELEAIGALLQRAQRPLFYRASVWLTPHRNYAGTHFEEWSVDGAPIKGYDDLDKALRAFERWALRTLHREYEYLTSEEAIAEAIRANGYEFDANGRLY